MVLTHLKLHRFRNYDSLDIDFDPKLNLILGKNGTGKSNLAEAIFYLSLARSWRTSEDRLLVKEGEEVATIEASIQEGPLNRSVSIELSKSHKRIAVNGKNVRRLSELSALTNVICFSPGDVPLFMGNPGVRRNFLDVSLAKSSLDYFTLIARYDRLLRERNAALKEASPNLRLLDVLTEQMIEVSLPLIRLRALYVNEINRVLPGILNALKGPGSSGTLVYRPFVKGDENFTENARAAFKKALESDLKHRTTSVGPHREDLSFLLNGKDLADYGSQGENRMAVLSLKLAPYFLIEDPEKKPILVLDDVASELDETHTKNLFAFIKTLGQVFVTATEIQTPDAAVIDVSEGKATRRK